MCGRSLHLGEVPQSLALDAHVCPLPGQWKVILLLLACDPTGRTPSPTGIFAPFQHRQYTILALSRLCPSSLRLLAASLTTSRHTRRERIPNLPRTVLGPTFAYLRDKNKLDWLTIGGVKIDPYKYEALPRDAPVWVNSFGFFKYGHC